MPDESKTQFFPTSMLESSASLPDLVTSLVVQIQPLQDDVIIPQKSYEQAAGWDVFAPRDIYVPIDAVTLVPLGFKTALPGGWCAILKERSGLGKEGVQLFGGVIDSDYRGEWMVALKANLAPMRIPQGKAIAQFLIVPVPSVTLQVVKELSQTVRGDRGFGSSG